MPAGQSAVCQRDNLRYASGTICDTKAEQSAAYEDTQQAGEPSQLIVVTAVGRAFETIDDIAVVPITLVGP